MRAVLYGQSSKVSIGNEIACRPGLMQQVSQHVRVLGGWLDDDRGRGSQPFVHKVKRSIRIQWVGKSRPQRTDTGEPEQNLPRETQCFIAVESRL